MAKKHKYFREQDYQQRLLRLANMSSNTTGVYFRTVVPDPKHIRAARNYYGGILDCVSDTTREQLETGRPRNAKFFIYYHKPEVSTRLGQFDKKRGFSKAAAFYKRQTNRKVRQAFKQHGNIYQNNEYKKVLDLDWELY